MKIRDKLREFLGLEGLATKVNIAGMEQANRDRHAEVLTRLARIEQQFRVEHVGRKITPTGFMGYEEAQLQELAEMLANPQNEKEQ